MEKNNETNVTSVSEDSKGKTGYPSKDKPWLKYYTNDAILSDLPNETIYNYIKERSVNYIDKTALNYFGEKITYKELIEKIDETARALKQYGINKGDIVTVLMPTIPETIYIFYALSKIGAIANMVDPRTSVEGIEDYTKEANSKLLMIIDVAADKVKDIKKTTNIDDIVVISPKDSMSFKTMLSKAFKDIKEIYDEKSKEAVSKISYLKVAGNYFKELKKGESKFAKSGECLSWKEFLDLGKKYNDPTEEKYEKDRAVVIVHTGGTTGRPKGVMLSNDNLNSASYQCEQAGYDFKSAHSWLNIMPPFIAYGIGNGLHLPLACGMEVILIPQFDPNKFDDLLIEYKPNHMVGVPSHYGSIIKSKKMADENLDYIIAPTVGGDKMDENLEKETNAFLAEHNCPYMIVKGYGMTEVNAAVAACTSNLTNEIGSVGIPFPKTTISIFEPGTENELKYNELGEVCITGPNTMIGYYNNPEETKKILKTHSDGKVWVHSGDLGYMDENGFLYIVDRIKRMIIRHDGFKIFPNMIEEVIMSHPAVHNCIVVGVKDVYHSQGNLPKAHIILKDDYDYDYDSIEKEITNLCLEKLAEYSQPVELQFDIKFPLTSIGKIDFVEMQRIDNANIDERVKKLSLS